MKLGQILFFILLSLVSYSQKKLIFKPLIGINTNIKSLVLTKEQFLGVDIGIQIEKKITNRISFESGFCFSIVRGNTNRPLVFINSPTIPETYYVTDIYNFNSIKLPINLLFNLKKSSRYLFSLGGYLKYNSQVNSSQRSNRSGVYSNFKDFYLKTENGNRVGVGLQARVSRSCLVAHKQLNLGIYDDFDFSKWMYPRNGNSESPGNYLFRKTNLSLLITMKL